MARSTMTSKLIPFVRDRIGDSANPQTFTDDQIQTALDAARLDIYEEVLIPVYTYSGTVIVWLDHYSRYPFWEDSPTLLDSGLNVLTPANTEPLREPDDEGKAAHFQFATNQISVRATGHSFNVWQVCADLLEQRIAGLMLTSFDFTADGQSIRLSQTVKFMQDLATSYRSKQGIHTIQTYRQDVLSEAAYQRRQRVGIVNADTPFLTGQ